MFVFSNKQIRIKPINTLLVKMVFLDSLIMLTNIYSAGVDLKKIAFYLVIVIHCITQTDKYKQCVKDHLFSTALSTANDPFSGRDISLPPI